MTSETITCDALIVGSGAGGLATAVTARKLGLDVIVVEKEPFFGGTTARSGGVLWVPGNPVNARKGVKDSATSARKYLQHEAGNLFDPARVDAFLANGPRMVEFFEAYTSVKFMSNEAFPDYHPGAEGAVDGGRSIVAAPMYGPELGENFALLRPPLREITFVGMMFNASQEVQHFFRATKSAKSFAYVVKRLFAHTAEMARHGRAARLTNGNALAGRLLKSAVELGVQLRIATAARQILVENGAVTGAIVEGPSGRYEIRTRRGVVLASGGFPRDEALRKEFFPHAPTGAEHWSPAPPGNTGDGLRLGRSAGGVVESRLPNAAAWIPVSLVPHSDGTIGHFPHLIDRYKPGIIAVTRDGKRFVNEADSYHDFGKAMIAANEGQGEAAAWLICDAAALARYGMGFVKPLPVPHIQHLRSGYLLKGASLSELAKKAGIAPVALEETVRRYNGPAAEGKDPEFHKGENAYNRFLGDASHLPNACVAPLDKAPFYAIKVVLGDLGTFAGLRTDANARVIAESGIAVPGLFAVGNDMASIMGGNYPGGGITLGPAMTFGYIAAHYLAGVSPGEPPSRIAT